MEKEKAIEVLNSLITINNDRIECYETASKETAEFELKTLFAQLISSSQKCKNELVMEVNKLVGKAAEDTMSSGKFFIMWREVKAALTGNDPKAIFNFFENGLDKAKDAYDEAVENNLEHMSFEQQTMIIDQRTLLKADYDHVKALRNALVEA